MIDLTPIVNAIIALAAAIATAFLIPWIRSKTTAEEREDLLAWVRIAVAAAEMIDKAWDGPAKKAYVLDFLAGQGFKVDESAIDAAIEAAVKEMKTGITQEA